MAAWPVGILGLPESGMDKQILQGHTQGWPSPPHCPASDPQWAEDNGLGRAAAWELISGPVGVWSFPPVPHTVP